MKLAFQRIHKSIQWLDQTELPDFAVITGPNGCGKTHLLEAILAGAVSIDSIDDPPRQIKYFSWNNLAPRGTGDVDPLLFFREKIDTFRAIEAQRAKEAENFASQLQARGITSSAISFEQAANISRTDFETKFKDQQTSINFATLQQLLATARANIRRVGDISRGRGGKNSNELISLLETCAGIDLLTVNEEQFTSACMTVAGGGDPFALRLSEIISSYNYQFQRSRYNKYLHDGGEEIDFLTEQQFQQQYGPPPWILLNKVFTELGLGYELEKPSQNMHAKYGASLKSKDGQTTVRFENLSSGEKILMSLALSLYRARGNQKQSQIPKLLLFDEIDAPLHPSMTQQMLYVVDEMLAQRLGVKVILTTHSPSTVALCSDKSLFRLLKSPRKILKTTKEEAIQELSSGLISVTDNTKFIIVEGKDKLGYNQIFAACVKRDYLNSVPPLAFIEALNKRGERGDKGQVASWTNRFSEAGLGNIFGLIDGDLANKSAKNLYVLNRYSIENYLLDPLVIYALLLDRGEHQALWDLKFSRHEASELLGCDQHTLQAITDAVCEKLEKLDAGPDQTQDKFTAQYASGKDVQLPGWYKTIQGHRLEGLINVLVEEKMGLAPICRPKLEPVVRMLTTKIPEFLPRDLIELFRSIQTA